MIHSQTPIYHYDALLAKPLQVHQNDPQKQEVQNAGSYMSKIRHYFIKSSTIIDSKFLAEGS